MPRFIFNTFKMKFSYRNQICFRQLFHILWTIFQFTRVCVLFTNRQLRNKKIKKAWRNFEPCNKGNFLNLTTFSSVHLHVCVRAFKVSKIHHAPTYVPERKRNMSSLRRQELFKFVLIKWDFCCEQIFFNFAFVLRERKFFSLFVLFFPLNEVDEEYFIRHFFCCCKCRKKKFCEGAGR